MDLRASSPRPAPDRPADFHSRPAPLRRFLPLPRPAEKCSAPHIPGVEAWDSISCIALSRVRAHFHKLVSMVCPGRKMVPAAVHATPQFQFGLVRTPNEKWEELVSTAPGSRLWFGLVRNFGENWEEPGCPRRYIPHQCPDLAPRWDLDGSHLGRCKFKKKVRIICEYCEYYLHVIYI